jgi:hypothetical protein
LALFTEGEDIITEDIFLSVVLVNGAVLNVMDEVVFEGDSGATFIGVEAPSSVACGIDIMDMVVGHV